jgi:hypothetical protein
MISLIHKQDLLNYIRSVKKAAVALLTALFFISNTEFHELLKIPILITHYQEHKSETPGLTLAQFLSSHYTNNNTKDNDYTRDSQLPFKTAEHLSTSITVFLSHFDVKLPVPHFNNNVDLPFYRASFVSFPLLSNIWQPPKF